MTAVPRNRVENCNRAEQQHARTSLLTSGWYLSARRRYARLISLGAADGETPSTSYGDSLRPPPAPARTLTLERRQRCAAGPRQERRAKLLRHVESPARHRKQREGEGGTRRRLEATNGRDRCSGAAACSCSAMAQPEAEEWDLLPFEWIRDTTGTGRIGSGH
jgi:hypothetical protein